MRKTVVLYKNMVTSVFRIVLGVFYICLKSVFNRQCLLKTDFNKFPKTFKKVILFFFNNTAVGSPPTTMNRGYK